LLFKKYKIVKTVKLAYFYFKLIVWPPLLLIAPYIGILATPLLTHRVFVCVCTGGISNKLSIGTEGGAEEK
jgi:hypothetical protein